MYNKIECVTISCDNCGKNYENYNGFTIFVDKDTALDNAQNDGWITEEEKHYCEECHSFNDNDELQLKPINKY